MKKILMVAFHFPPCFGSSGLHRSYNFTKYLPDHGWEPIVITANKRAYPAKSDASPSDPLRKIMVHRAFGLDTARHLSVKGRYPFALSIPDRWWTWILPGVSAGIALIGRHRPKCIWVTYPIPSAFLIGWALHKITRIPLIADFRDPLGQDRYPENVRLRKVYWRIEKLIVNNAVKCVMTTPSALQLYRKRYPDIPENRWSLIENGFDEALFREAAECMEENDTTPAVDNITLLHSGILYPKDRNPLPFFKAVAALKKEGVIQKKRFHVLLRASGNERLYQENISALGIEEIVSLKRPVDNRSAIKEMLKVDGLLLFQGASCNAQIPAKAYEYIRSEKMILALTDKTGDTAKLLEKNPFTIVVDMESPDDIKKGLVRLLGKITSKSKPQKDAIDISKYSRKSRTIELAQLLNTLFDDEK